jgi:hypothetical protein
MKLLLALILPISFFFSCKSGETNSKIVPGIIENQTFNTTVLIDGHDYDGTIIRNCVFEEITGDGLQIRDVNGLIIQDCIFKDISENAIRFRNSGSSENVKIVNNEIFNIKENGILAPENHINCLIEGNIIYNIATSNISSQFGSPHHGIYFQGFNVTISKNTIYDILNDQGNCISIRTFGTVSRNRLYGATDHGISYFSDHPGDRQELLIENNIIYDNGKRCINLASNGMQEHHIGKAIIRFNTLVSTNDSPIGINDELSDVEFGIIGNVVIRTDGAETFFFTSHDFENLNNITASDDIGFVDFNNRALNIMENSIARNAAIGTINFPDIDFEGNQRLSDSLDSGAFEIE